MIDKEGTLVAVKHESRSDVLFGILLLCPAVRVSFGSHR